MITIDYLYRELAARYHVNRNRIEFLSHPLETVMFITEFPLSPEFLYITYGHKLDADKLFGISVISIGSPRFNYSEAEYDLIIIDEEISIEHLNNEIQLIFRKFQKWEAKLTEILQTTKSIPDLLETLALVFPYEVQIHSKDGSYTSASKKNANTLNDLSLINDLKFEKGFNALEKRNDVFMYPDLWVGHNCLCYNVYFEEKYEARITTAFVQEHFSKDEIQIFEIFSRYVQKLYDIYQIPPRYSSHNSSLKKQIKKMLYNQTFSEREIEKILDNLGWQTTDSYYVIAFIFSNNSEIELANEFMSNYLEFQYPGTVTLYLDQKLIWVVNHRICQESKDHLILRQLPEILRESICKAGISSYFNNFFDLKAYYKQAIIAIDIGMRKDPTKWYYSFNEYILEYMLINACGEFSPAQLCHPGLLKLIDYDSQNHTNLCETLYQYIACMYNSTTAANNLCVHRSTFLYRLKRIEEIGDIHFRTIDDQLKIIITFYLLNLKY